MVRFEVGIELLGSSVGRANPVSCQTSTTSGLRASRLTHPNLTQR